jgi:hypothetical protein
MQPIGASSVFDTKRLPESGGPLASGVLHFWETINSLPWIALLFLLFATQVVTQRNKKEGWIAAALAGVAFLGVMSQIFARF